MKNDKRCMIPFTWHAGEGKTIVEENRSVRGWEVGLNTRRYGRVGGDSGTIPYLYLIGMHLSKLSKLGPK